MWRYEAGMPRSPKSQVNMWVASGEWEKKSQTLSGLLVVGVRVGLLGVDEVGELRAGPG